MADHERPSGNPAWDRPVGEQAVGRGVPAIPAPADEPAGARTEGRPVASWLGWSPTRWRKGN